VIVREATEADVPAIAVLLADALRFYDRLGFVASPWAMKRGLWGRLVRAPAPAA
jgi:hypothetical protein